MRCPAYSVQAASQAVPAGEKEEAKNSIHKSSQQILHKCFLTRGTSVTRASTCQNSRTCPPYGKLFRSMPKDTIVHKIPPSSRRDT
jgi:hypothetical protein